MKKHSQQSLTLNKSGKITTYKDHKKIRILYTLCLCNNNLSDVRIKITSLHLFTIVNHIHLQDIEETSIQMFFEFKQQLGYQIRLALAWHVTGLISPHFEALTIKIETYVDEEGTRLRMNGESQAINCLNVLKLK